MKMDIKLLLVFPYYKLCYHLWGGAGIILSTGECGQDLSSETSGHLPVSTV